MSPSRATRTVPILLVAGCAALAQAAALELAANGRALAPIVLADGASEAEATAARELADYLSRVTGASFALVSESDHDPQSRSIQVGPTRRALRAGPDPALLGAEEWIVRTDADHLLLYGGRPRGALYAVYQFLERQVGVRWWTPYVEHVPRRPDLRVADLDQRGRPVFAYRDISVDDGPVVFRARSRLNGHASRLPAAWGGAESFGPPHHAHTFYLYVPPAEHFDQHPQYFSEIAGLRYGGEAQLCLTDPELLDLVAERMGRYIERARERAAAQGAARPRLFSFSQNDWARPCECERCSALVRREGGQAGPLLDFVNRLAERIGGAYPEVWVESLAYHYTLDPPLALRAAPNVVIRLTGLHQRDFTKPVTDPANREYAAALDGWSARTDHLHVWDYAVIFGDFGELPLPNLAALAQDYALYHGRGVEGVYVQLDFPIAGELRDLKLWVIAKLLEDPHRDHEALVHEFTDGFYGPAGKSIRRYLRVVERSARRHPATVAFRADPSDYTFLDEQFFARAHRIFDRAERLVRDDPELLRRVRHARLSVDRASLVLWNTASAAGRSTLDFEAVARRYRGTWRDQIELRLPRSGREAARAEVEREIDYWSRIHLYSAEGGSIYWPVGEPSGVP